MSASGDGTSIPIVRTAVQVNCDLRWLLQRQALEYIQMTTGRPIDQIIEERQSSCANTVMSEQAVRAISSLVSKQQNGTTIQR